MTGLRPAFDDRRRSTPGWRNVRLGLRYWRLWPKLAVNYARARRGERVLRGVEFAITFRCNLHCRHCLRTKLIDEAATELSRAEILDAVRQIARLGGVFVNFTGGEASLRPDILDIVGDAATVPRLIVTLASNGYELDAAKIAALAGRGLAMLVLSLDGATAATHDAFRRQPGSFARTAAAVREAKARGLDVWLTCVATNEGLLGGEVRRTAEVARDWRCTFTLNLPYDVGAWEGGDVALMPDAYAEYRNLLRLPWVRWEGSSNWLGEGCPAGVEKIYITPYGDVMPCAVIHRSYGNLRRESLATIYARLGEHPAFRDCRKACLVAEDRTPLESRDIG